jgi:hypothetical protein
MTLRTDHAVQRRRVAAVLALLLLGSTAASAVEPAVTLRADEAAIVFMVVGQGRGGDIEVRDARNAPIWDTLLTPAASVRQFKVRPGAYSMILARGEAPIPVAVKSGYVALISLVGEPASGSYRLISQSAVKVRDVPHTVLPDFIDQYAIAPLDYAPVVLDRRGLGLSFALRADF